MFTRLRHMPDEMDVLGATGLPVPLQFGSCSRAPRKNNLRDHGRLGSPMMCLLIDCVSWLQQHSGERIHVDGCSSYWSASSGQKKHWQASGTLECIVQFRGTLACARRYREHH